VAGLVVKPVVGLMDGASKVVEGAAMTQAEKVR
jgi:hypothetical protein